MGDNGQMGEGEGGQPPMLGNPVSTSRWMSDTNVRVLKFSACDRMLVFFLLYLEN